MHSFPFRFALLSMLAVLIALSAGCGDTATTTDSASVKTGTTETPVAAPEPSPGEPPVEAQEESSPYGPGLTTAQTVGTLIDGLQLSNIRFADHGTYYRIVFEMATPDGKPVLQVPHAEASLSGQTLRVELGGIRSISGNPNVTASEIPVGDTTVKSIRRTKERDDQALVYEISLAKPATYSLAGLGSPGRIIVDITK